MKIALGFACLVTAAILLGESLAEIEECTCSYVPGLEGCKLGPNQPVTPGQVCRCRIVEGVSPITCSHRLVSCYLPGSNDCRTTANTYTHCMQGVYDVQGDCCGYSERDLTQCRDRVRGGNQGNTRLFGLGNLATQQGFGNQGGILGQVGGFPGQIGGIQGGFGVGGFQGGASGSNSCRRWCRTPQGQAYCCESANQPLSAADIKPGQCPPVRPQCPPTRIHAPTTCSSDGGCPNLDKCCFDTCLQHHTCKPPSSFYG